jgi:DNA repair exonuclease SbcCD nuclease subunit
LPAICVTGDWHISGQGDLVCPEDGRNLVLRERGDAARLLVRQAHRAGARAILHLGDMFDRPRPTPTEMWEAAFALAFTTSDPPLPTLVLEGNHERPRRGEWSPLDLLAMVRQAAENATERDLQVAREPMLGTLHADDLLFEVLLVPGPGALASALALADLHPDPRLPRIVAAHLGIAGAVVGGRLVPEHVADCALSDLRELAARAHAGVVALGHYHCWQVLSSADVIPDDVEGAAAYGEENAPLIFYAGSPTAIGFGEEGEQKRVCLLEWTGGTGWALRISDSPGAVRFTTLSPEEAAEYRPGEREKMRISANRGQEQEAREAAAGLRERGAADVRIAVKAPEAAAPRMELPEAAPWEQTMRAFLSARGGPAGEPMEGPEVEECISAAREAKDAGP